MTNDCIPYCKKSCELTEYDYSSSHLKYPIDEHYFDKFPEKYQFKNYDYSFLKERVIMLKINLKGTEYIEIEVIPKTLFQDLISSIGGFLGFTIGASILSLFEIGEVLLKLILLIPKSFRRCKADIKPTVERKKVDRKKGSTQ